MRALASRFNPVQDIDGDTSSRPIAPLGTGGRERSASNHDDSDADFLVTRARRPGLAQALPPFSDQALTEPNTAADAFGERTSPVRVYRPPRAPAPRDRFIALQKWEGTVLAVEGDAFTASLRDLTDRRRSDENVALPIDEVEDSDRFLLVPGAVFYWTLGYRVNMAGNRERVATLRFRRLPAWTEAELIKARQEAERLFKFFGGRG